MTNWQAWMACGLLMSLPVATQADIFRWDNGQLIPGTEGITPGPATQLGPRVLQFADLSNTNLTGSSFYDYRSHGSDLTGARFTNANLSYAFLHLSNLTGADFAGATVIGTKLYGTQGFTKEQLYSTASYQAKDLHEIGLGIINLTGWELSGQDLTGAHFSLSTLTDANLGGAHLRNAYFDRATLTNADLSGTNLTNAVLGGATLTNANLAGAMVTGANFGAYFFGGSPSRGFTKEQLYSTASYQQRNLRGIGLSYNDLTGWDFSGQDLSDAELGGATLTNANLAGAMVTGANFGTYFEIPSRGFTKEQLYSTVSYQQRNLRGIGLGGNDLTGWDFSGQDLTGADFGSSTLTNANLSGTNLTDAVLSEATLTNANLAGAMVTGANFESTTWPGFTKEQLYSTASYQQRNLRGIGLGGSDLTGWDFSGQDFTGANLGGSTLTNANLSGTNLTDAYLSTANLTNANFAGAVIAGANFFRGYDLEGSGITLPQLYSTASYQQRNLRGIVLSDHDLTGGDFSGQDLSGAYLEDSMLTNANLSGTNLTDAALEGATLTNANLAGAVVAGADFSLAASFFGSVGSGITLLQLYSTGSYQQRNLRGIGLSSNDLTGGDFSGQDLSGAYLGGSTLTNANLAGAMVTGASFAGTTSQGFTKDQLYSTASYQQRNLNGINLSYYNNLTGWDFNGQDLAGADFTFSQLTNGNFSFADLRGARLDGAGPIQLARNTIRESGAINGLDLAAGETLVVRDSTIGITVNDSMNAVSGGTLELVLGDADWGSTMAVAAGVTPDLGGTLRVRFADQANLAPLLGTTFDFFDWPAVLETNNRFDAIELPPGTLWDFSQLYATGTAKLTFIPVTTGDYNRDGTVDAADYVVWRNGLGTTYTQADYDVWRAHFGQTIGSGGAGYGHRDSGPGDSAKPLSNAVPEPATLTLLIMAMVAQYARRRSTVAQNSCDR